MAILTRNDSGFSIVEIVIACIIVSILATIAIPVLINQAEKAKVAAALSDLERLANAQERAAIDLGHYLRLYVLDNVDGGDGIGLGAPGNVIDGIADEPANTLFNNPYRILVDLKTQELVPTAQAQVFFQSFLVSSTSESPYRWGGPYINIHRDETLEQHSALTTPRHLHGIPNDPWGNDYLFFTREGLILEPDGILVTGIEFGGTTVNTLVFDRPTILSLGPNGVPGLDENGNFAFGRGDDLYRSFGF